MQILTLTMDQLSNGAEIDEHPRMPQWDENLTVEANNELERKFWEFVQYSAGVRRAAFVMVREARDLVGGGDIDDAVLAYWHPDGTLFITPGRPNPMQSTCWSFQRDLPYAQIYEAIV